MKKKTKLWLNLGLTVFFILAIFVQSPNLNPVYPDGAFSWCFIISCYVVLNFLLGLGKVRVSLNPGTGGFKLDVNKENKSVKNGFKLLGVIWALYLVASVASSAIVNYPAYRDQLGEPEKAQFTQEVQPIALDQLPIVDKALASALADKKVGENPGMGSQVMLGEPVIQQVRGKLVWVVPLEHSGFFKWLKNMSGSAGYVVVSATDLQEVQLVTDFKLKYQPSAYLFDDLMRHTRFFGGGLFSGLTDASFELDDEGQPYWAITTYQNKWLFELPEATGVQLVNATTGESHHYGMDAIPEWVDRVQPESFVMNQIDNQGQYVHGFLNFSNQDKFRASQGHIIVYNEGNCYLFTGLTSVGSDESAMGFMMVDMVTKESKMYQMSGATEAAAQSSAQGKVQQYGYRASFPMIINLDGKPTYFMTLKDNAGLIKQYAFVSVADYTSVGTGETVTAALRNFRQVVGGTGHQINTGDKTETVRGTVDRIASESLGDTITYKMILDEYPGYIFTAAYDLSNELALTKTGDEVEINYVVSETGICSATSFNNLMYEQSKDGNPPVEVPEEDRPVSEPASSSEGGESSAGEPESASSEASINASSEAASSKAETEAPVT